MSQGAGEPSFDEWVEYCFTDGYRDFCGWADEPDDVVTAREERYHTFAPRTITSYLTRLFESPGFIADRYTDEQIADATWFIFGSSASSYIHDARSPGVPREEQVRCLASVATMYTRLFDRVCGERGSNPDEDLREKTRLDGAVYMIWDMGGVEGTVLFPGRLPHLEKPGIEVLETILTECRTSACRTSALHGIGHI
jgi:hypothetical protein